MNRSFETRDDGYFCRVGDASRLFTFADYGGKGTYNAASKWYTDQQAFQMKSSAHAQCLTSCTKLKSLVDELKTDFPTGNRDYFFLIDDYRQCLAVVFGSLLITEADEGFNIEIITNWLTKDRLTVCNGVPMDVAVAVVRNSPASKTFRDIEPRQLHLSAYHRQTLVTLCTIK